MNYTEDQLKDALTRALPDALEFDEESCQYFWQGAPPARKWPAVTAREWPAIVGVVEDRVFESPIYRAYVATPKVRCGEPVTDAYSTNAHIIANWQTRAQALADIGAITIEP